MKSKYSTQQKLDILKTLISWGGNKTTREVADSMGYSIQGIANWQKELESYKPSDAPAKRARVARVSTDSPELIILRELERHKNSINMMKRECEKVERKIVALKKALEVIRESNDE